MYKNRICPFFMMSPMSQRMFQVWRSIGHGVPKLFKGGICGNDAEKKMLASRDTTKEKNTWGYKMDWAAVNTHGSVVNRFTFRNNRPHSRSFAASHQQSASLAATASVAYVASADVLAADRAPAPKRPCTQNPLVYWSGT